MSDASQMHAQRLEFIATEPVREAYRYLVDYASRLNGYHCYPDMNGYIQSFRYADSKSQPRSQHRYSFITNRKWLLFYFRRPSDEARPITLSRLRRVFPEANENTDGELTIRIKRLEDARRLMAFVFEGEVQERGSIKKVIVRVKQRSNGLSDESGSEQSQDFIPQEGDERALIERQIRERRGQQSFRNDLRQRYGDRCLVTGCKVLAVLEAAHIKPYQGEKDNHPENGLLLRADIHTLFDLDLLGIEPKSLRVELHPSLTDSAAYKNLAGKTLRCPAKQRPSKDALKLRYERFKERLIQPTGS